MGNSISSNKQEPPKIKRNSKRKESPVIKEGRKLVLNGDMEGAFAVLKKGAEEGDVMACFDVGIMMIEGIGSVKNMKY